MKLYYSPGACSLAPHIVANEAGLKVDAVKVDIPGKKTETGDDYWQVNFKGYVPTLQLDNGEMLTEASVICQYLADQKPDSGLAPKQGTMERYRLMEWLNFVAAEMHKQFGLLFNPKVTPEMREVQLAVIGRKLKPLDTKLADKRQYLMGDKFTVADAYAFTVLRWADKLKIDLNQWPNVKAYFERVGQRAKIRETLKEEGLA
ncbi:MAG TPA: glutathione transferase GstA [Dehalococcoidia bacterium]|nr:glutathione transferase GstA [Dehalococcoidia bacterium]